jgi:transposase-like protein
MELFHRLYVAQEGVEEVCAHTGLSANAVHQWRRRLGQAAQKSLAELQMERAAPRAVAAPAERDPADIPFDRTRSTR